MKRQVGELSARLRAAVSGGSSDTVDDHDYTPGPRGLGSMSPRSLSHPTTTIEYPHYTDFFSNLQTLNGRSQEMLCFNPGGNIYLYSIYVAVP